MFIDAVLRLQIRLDDFRKLHDARNRSLKNEDIAYETLRNGLKVKAKIIVFYAVEAKEFDRSYFLKSIIPSRLLTLR